MHIRDSANWRRRPLGPLPRASLIKGIGGMQKFFTMLGLLCFASFAQGTDENSRSVASWRFGTEEISKLSPHGGVHRDQAGPRPPEFPDFPAGNTAVRLDGQGARFVAADPGPNSNFDFTNGDAITLHA